jgi:hypothetical protein
MSPPPDLVADAIVSDSGSLVQRWTGSDLPVRRHRRPAGSKGRSAVSAFSTSGFSLFGLRSRKTGALMMLDNWPKSQSQLRRGTSTGLVLTSNARTHSPEQIEQLRNSFRTYGQVWPILVREDGMAIWE